MDEATKKIALRLVPYDVFVLDSRSGDGKEAAGSMANWVTQASFQPPLVAVGGRREDHTIMMRNHDLNYRGLVALKGPGLPGQRPFERSVSRGQC
jgi:hypothetical protein